MCGIDVVGLSTHQFRQVRAIYHAGLGTGKRRSVAMDLALHGVTDPAIDAHAEVIRLWTVSRWDPLLPVGMIDQVFQFAYAK
eukprot:3697455-Pyramimonas_sp.AAC.1